MHGTPMVTGPRDLGFADIARVGVTFGNYPAGTLAICAKPWTPDDDDIALLFADNRLRVLSTTLALQVRVERVCSFRTFLELCVFVALL